MNLHIITIERLVNVNTIAFSLTMIDNHRAVLFGGIHAGSKSNDAYALDLAKMILF